MLYTVAMLTLTQFDLTRKQGDFLQNAKIKSNQIRTSTFNFQAWQLFKNDIILSPLQRLLPRLHLAFTELKIKVDLVLFNCKI